MKNGVMRRTTEHKLVTQYLKYALSATDTPQNEDSMAKWFVEVLVSFVPHKNLPELALKLERDIRNNKHIASRLLNNNEKELVDAILYEFGHNCFRTKTEYLPDLDRPIPDR